MSEEVKQAKPKKPLYKRWWVWLLAIIVFIIIASSSSKPKESIPAQADKPEGAQAAQQVTPASTPTAMQSLLKISGSGTKSTQKFTAGKDWDVSWDYDCGSAQGGIFQVYVYNGDGTPSFANGLINQTGKSGKDVEHYHNGGEYYLQVNSTCKWNVEVKG